MAKDLFKLLKDFLKNEHEVEERDWEAIETDETAFEVSIKRRERKRGPEDDERTERRPRAATLNEIVEAVGAEEGEVEEVKETMKANEDQIVHIPHEDPAQVRYGLAEHAHHFANPQAGLNPGF